MKDTPITKESFDSLLEWLDSDRVLAAERYEEIHHRLVKLFMTRGCADAEGLADETMNRVAVKVPAIKELYRGDPAWYFSGVAKNVFLEYRRLASRSYQSFQTYRAEETGNIELEHLCLHECLANLDSAKRELILLYYQGEKRGRIDSRRELSARLGITPYSLRKRVERVRMALEDCVFKCIAQNKL